MNNSIDQLSQLILEADALLLLLHKHKEETPSDAIVMLKRKLQVILILIDDFDEVESAEPEQEADADVNPPMTAVEELELAPEKDEPVFFTQHEIVEMPAKEVEAAVDHTWDEVADELEDMVEGASVAESENENEKGRPEVRTTVEEQLRDVAGLTIEENRPLEKPQPTAPKIEPTVAVEPVATPKTMPKDAPRRPVSTVFNLNDKFRFRRELFGNSEIAYVECLNMLSAMYSLEEATEYLYEDLNWDPNNEDVKSFVELLKNYYNG